MRPRSRPSSGLRREFSRASRPIAEPPKGGQQRQNDAGGNRSESKRADDGRQGTDPSRVAALVPPPALRAVGEDHRDDHEGGAHDAAHAQRFRGRLASSRSAATGRMLEALRAGMTALISVTTSPIP